MKQRKTEHPILMCGEMVRAILAGKKTETRRMAGLKHMNRKPDDYIVNNIRGTILGIGEDQSDRTVTSPYGVAGDTLWVREGWMTYASLDSLPPSKIIAEPGITYCAGGSNIAGRNRLHGMGKTRISMHMPRWASRITLTVKSVTLERLHEITDEGARAEGITDGGCLNCGNPEPCGCGNPKPSPRDAYIGLWKQLNGEESWNLNPWVWVVKFEVKEVRK